MSRIRWNRSRLLVAAVVGCLVPIFIMGPGRAAPTSYATSIEIRSISTPSVTVPSTPDTPSIWAAVGTPFTVEAAGIFGAAEAPLSNKDLKVNVEAVVNGSSVSLGQVTWPANATTFSFSKTVSTAFDNVFIRLTTVEKGSTLPRTGQSGTFDVQSDFKFAGGLDVAIGGEVTGSTCQPTVAKKMCFQVHIPANAIVTGEHLVSLGNCNVINPCRQDQAYLWDLVNVQAFDRLSPIVTDIGLDKSLKGVVIENGVPKTKILVRASGVQDNPDDPLNGWVEAPPCPGKGVIGADQEFCQDASASKRDNSGDTWVKLLWLRDIRTSTK